MVSASPKNGNMVQIKGKLRDYDGKLVLHRKDVKGFEVKGRTSMVKATKNGNRWLLDVWSDLLGHRLRAGAISFSSTVAAGKSTTVDLGHYSERQTHLKLHVKDGNIEGLSAIFDKSKE